MPLRGQELATAQARASLAASERDSLATLLRSYEATGDTKGASASMKAPCRHGLL